MENYFSDLNAINVSDKTEKKNGLTYLSWAWAWGELKKKYPDSIYTVYEWTDEKGCPQFYFTDGKTCWVKTGVTVNGIEHIEFLPVMDYKNRSIPAESVTSFDVNKAIQRSLTKAVARHGLGLYVYAGEDLPEDEAPKTGYNPPPVSDVLYCAECGGAITDYDFGSGLIKAEEIARQTAASKIKKCLCGKCYEEWKAKNG